MVESKRRPWYRLHATSYLALLLTATVAAMLNLSYQYTPSFDVIFFYSNEGAEWTNTCSSGWPWTFLETREHYLPELTLHSWSSLAFLADVLIGVAIVSVTTGLFEFRRRRRRRLLHVTLADVMIVMFAVCLVLAWRRGLVTQYEARQAVVQQIQDGGGHVSSTLLLPQALTRTDVTDKSARARAWCRDQLADALYFLKQPLIVRMPTDDPHVWSSLWRFGEVRILTFQSDKPDGSVEKFISTLAKLERLSLNGTGITDGDAEAISRLPELRGLALTNTAITDEGLAHIARRRPLVDLDLNGTKITDVGLSQVAKITQLRELNLSNTAVTSAGFDQLHGHPALRTLTYQKTGRNPDLAPCETLVLKNMPRLEVVNVPMPLARLHLENLPRIKRLPSPPEDRGLSFGGGISYWFPYPRIDVANLTLHRLPSLASLTINARSLKRLEITDTESLHEFVVRDHSYPPPAERYDFDDLNAGVLGEITSLRSLVLTKARLTPAGWAKLATLPNLRSLDLTGSNVQDSDLARFAHLTQLEELSLADTRISDAGWQGLPDLPQLTRLSLRNTRVTCIDFSGHDELTSLDLSGSPIHELRLTGLHELKGTLQLAGNQLEVLELTDLPRLERLSLPQARVHSMALDGLTGLTHLDLSHTNAEDDWLTEAGRWSGLGEVLLRGTRVTDAVLEGISTLESLDRLDLEDTAVTDAGLEKIKDIATISVLNLTGTSVSDEGLAHLAGFQNLELLYLGRTRVRGPGLVHLRNLPALYKLSLGMTKVDSSSLAALRGMRNLRWLRLSDTRVDDRAFAHLRTLAGLDTLLLNGAAITDAGFVKSSLPPGLRFLDLRDTEVSEASIRQWRQGAGRLKIEWGPSQRDE